MVNIINALVRIQVASSHDNDLSEFSFSSVVTTVGHVMFATVLLLLLFESIAGDGNLRYKLVAVLFWIVLQIKLCLLFRSSFYFLAPD